MINLAWLINQTSRLAVIAAAILIEAKILGMI